MRRYAAALAAAVLTVAAAAPSASGAEPGAEPTIAALRAGGARVTALGERGGLVGYLVEPASGDGYSLYLTADGHAVAGLLYGPDARLVTGRQIADARRKAETGGDAGAARSGTAAVAAADNRGPRVGPGNPSGAADMARFRRSANAFGFTIGEAGPLAIVFADPTCPWSRSAVARLSRPAVAGRLRLRVVPVAVLGAGAARRAAAIAASDDPALAWFDPRARRAGGDGRRLVAANNRIFGSWGVNSVPLILWRGAGGRTARHVGDIEHVEPWLEIIARED